MKEKWKCIAGFPGYQVSLTEAAKKLYLKIRNISDVLRGRQRTTGGYTFIYSDGGNKR